LSSAAARSRFRIVAGQGVRRSEDARLDLPRLAGLGCGATGSCGRNGSANRAIYRAQFFCDLEAILDPHYLGRDVKVAEIAVVRLETRTKL
jgi:hypothetical protein